MHTIYAMLLTRSKSWSPRVQLRLIWICLRLIRHMRYAQQRVFYVITLLQKIRNTWKTLTLTSRICFFVCSLWMGNFVITGHGTLHIPGWFVDSIWGRLALVFLIMCAIALLFDWTSGGDPRNKSHSQHNNWET